MRSAWHLLFGLVSLSLVCSPAQARWLSVDPVQADPKTGANFNRYWYGNNNPYKFIDPDGRQATSIERAIDRDINDYLEGRISEDEYFARNRARGAGGLVGAVGAAALVGAPAVVPAAGKALTKTKKEGIRTVVCLVLGCGKVDPSSPRDTVSGDVSRTPTSRVVRDLERRRQNNETPKRERRDNEEQHPVPPKEDVELPSGI